MYNKYSRLTEIHSQQCPEAMEIKPEHKHHLKIDHKHYSRNDYKGKNKSDRRPRKSCGHKTKTECVMVAGASVGIS
jgi:hypothetical protein